MLMIRRVLAIALLTVANAPHNVLAAQDVIQEIPTDTFASAYVIPDSHRTTLLAYLVFNEGEFHNLGTEGLAHYVEHLAWLNAINTQGTSRHTNAWTNLYSTGYWLKFDKADIEHQLASLMSVVDPLSLDTEFMLEERAIIQQEYHYRNSDDDNITFARERKKALLGESKHTRSLLGTPAAIREFSLAEARQLHQQSHQLSKATLVIAGDVSSEEVKSWLDTIKLPAAQNALELAASVKGDTEQNADADAVSGREQSIGHIGLSGSDQSINDMDTSGTLQAVDEKDIKSDSIPVSTVYVDTLFEYDACGSNAHCDVTFRVLNTILDSSLPGGIANALRYDDFIASSFSIELYTLDESHAVASFSAQPDVGVTLEMLQEKFEIVWSAIATEGIPSESVERVRRRILGDLNGITNMPSYALNVAIAQLSVGEAVYSPDDYRSAVLQVRHEDVMTLLHNVHSEPRRVVVRRVAAQ